VFFWHFFFTRRTGASAEVVREEVERTRERARARERERIYQTAISDDTPMNIRSLLLLIRSLLLSKNVSTVDRMYIRMQGCRHKAHEHILVRTQSIRKRTHSSTPGCRHQGACASTQAAADQRSPR
jgi:hypothetical protein